MYLFSVAGAPTFVSRHHLLIQYWLQLYCQVQSEALQLIDSTDHRSLLLQREEAKLGLMLTHSVQLIPLLLFPG